MQIRIKKGEEIIEGVCVGRYFPKRFKLAHVSNEFSRELLWLKKHRNDALIEKYGKLLADVIRETGKQFDILTIPPASRQRLYYFCRELASVVAVELGLELIECLRWDERIRDSQGKRRGLLKLKRMSEPAICNYDMTGLRVLLLDDLLTTGWTSFQCQKSLKSAGASEVFVGILGKTSSSDPTAMGKMKAKVLKKKGEIVKKKRKQIQAVKKQKEFITLSTKTKGVNDGGR